MSIFVKEKFTAGSQIVMVKEHVAIQILWQPSVQKNPVEHRIVHFQEDQTFQDQ